VQELQDDADFGDMLQGIVCRVRSAITVGKAKDPVALEATQKSAAFVKYHKELAPLLGCVMNSKSSDVDCENDLPGLMGVVSKIMPEVDHLKTKLGAAYHQAVKKSC